MTEESYNRLKPLAEQVIESVRTAAGFDTHEAGIQALQESVQQIPSIASMAHETAIQVYPSSSGNTVDPAKFGLILGLINTPGKFDEVLRDLPEERVPEIEKMLRWMLREYLPSQRANFRSMAKHLPQRRAGGAPSTIPSAKECEEICADISSLHRRGVLLGVAQRSVARKRALSFRTVQRIWAKRKQNSPHDSDGSAHGRS